MKKNDLTFCIADQYIHLHFPEGVDGRNYVYTFGPFYVKEAKKPLMFDMEIGENLDDTSPCKRVVRENCNVNGNKYHIYWTDDGGYKIIIHFLKEELSAIMVSNADFTKCRVSLFGDDNIRSFGLNNAIMVAYAFSGCFHNILLFHSSVILHDGKGYCFLGKSGTGKSTHSDLWMKYVPDCEILNDDNPAVVANEDGTMRVYGTPWSGKRDFYKQKNVPIGAFVRLEQAPENSIERENVLPAFCRAHFVGVIDGMGQTHLRPHRGTLQPLGRSRARLASQKPPR